MPLFVVATPIGNLEDITLNAIKVLESADLILSENTLTTSNLLKHYNIFHKKIVNYTDYTSEESIAKFLEIAKNNRVCLVSEAGTPVISDPGYKIIKKAHLEGVKVHLTPGASSLIGAISVCGLPSYNFAFLGFYEKEKHKKASLFLQNNTTVAFFIPARDILKTLTELEKDFKTNPICIARELTKLFEDIKTDSIESLKTYYSSGEKLKGEAVLIISSSEAVEKIEIAKAMQKTFTEKPFLQNIKPKDLADILKTYEEDFKAFSKKEIYNFLIKNT